MATYDEDLQELVTKVIAQHLAEAGGGMVTAFHLVAEFVDADGERGWMYCTAAGQQQSQTMGLIEWSRGVAVYEQARYLAELGEEPE